MTASSGAGPILARWTRIVRPGDALTILPDGCRDAILVVAGDQEPRWLLSPLDAAPRLFTPTRRARLTGFRLHPAAQGDTAGLPGSADDAELALAATRLDPDLADALDVLAIRPSVTAAAKSLGCSPRTLQRLCRDRTGQGPLFWRRLARVRRAARGLATSLPLAEVAADGGFADQAHLTREIARWFGATPQELRRDPLRLGQALARGYADATGVQISTSVPSGART